MVADRLPRLLLATNNPGKLVEMRALLGAIPYTLVALAEVGITQSVEEPFETYLENATTKARAYADASGVLALADDSGLEIDAMPGELGVQSAYWGDAGGSQMPYPERCALIEARLAGLAPEQRTARYRCVMVLAEPSTGGIIGGTWHVEGICEGIIAPEPRGTHGFGYDPIFLIPAHGLTMAELSPAEKNTLSHRALAAQQMAALLRTR